MFSYLNKFINDVAFPVKSFDNHSNKVSIMEQTEIPYIHISSSAAKYVILYSHGNVANLDQLIPFLQQLADATSCAVFAYEYPDDPEPHKINVTIDHIWRFIQSDFGYKAQNVILMGRSIGSAPTLYLANKFNAIPAFVVLISPLSSIRDCVRSVNLCGLEQVLANFVEDTIDNVKMVKNLLTPLLLIHGKDDESLPVKMSKKLFLSYGGLNKHQMLHIQKGANHQTIRGADLIAEVMSDFRLLIEK